MIKNYKDKYPSINEEAYISETAVIIGDVTIEKIETYNGFDKNKMIQYIYSLEELSNHPISKVIKELGVKVEKLDIHGYQEISGHGIYAK